MQFLIDYQQPIVLIVVIAVLSISTLYLIPFLKKQNIITDENMLDAAHVINIAQNIVKLISVDNKVLAQTTIILESCKLALKYTTDVMNVIDVEEKRKITFDAVIETLTRLGIEVTEETKISITMCINLVLVNSK